MSSEAVRPEHPDSRQQEWRRVGQLFKDLRLFCDPCVLRVDKHDGKGWSPPALLTFSAQRWVSTGQGTTTDLLQQQPSPGSASRVLKGE